MQTELTNVRGMNYKQLEQMVIDKVNTDLKTTLTALDFLTADNLFIGSYGDAGVKDCPHKILLYFRYNTDNERIQFESLAQGMKQNQFYIGFEISTDFKEGRAAHLSTVEKLKEWLYTNFAFAKLKTESGYNDQTENDKSFMFMVMLQGNLNL